MFPLILCLHSETYQWQPLSFLCFLCLSVSKFYIWESLSYVYFCYITVCSKTVLFKNYILESLDAKPSFGVMVVLVVIFLSVCSFSNIPGSHCMCQYVHVSVCMCACMYTCVCMCACVYVYCSEWKQSVLLAWQMLFYKSAPFSLVTGFGNDFNYSLRWHSKKGMIMGIGTISIALTMALESPPSLSLCILFRCLCFVDLTLNF